jgi:plastocyanin
LLYPNPGILFKGTAFTARAHSKSTIASLDIVEGAALKGTSAFMPNPATVHTEGLVMWVNKDLVVHTITYGSGFSDPDIGRYFDSGMIGRLYEHKFTNPGEYSYFCQIHPTMAGKIIVKAPETVDMAITTTQSAKSNATTTIIPSNTTSLFSLQENSNNILNSSQNAQTKNNDSGNFIGEITNYFKGLVGIK